MGPAARAGHTGTLSETASTQVTSPGCKTHFTFIPGELCAPSALRPALHSTGSKPSTGAAAFQAHTPLACASVQQTPKAPAAYQRLPPPSVSTHSAELTMVRYHRPHQPQTCISSGCQEDIPTPPSCMGIVPLVSSLLKAPHPQL